MVHVTVNRVHYGLYGVTTVNLDLHQHVTVLVVVCQETVPVTVKRATVVVRVLVVSSQKNLLEAA